MIPLFPDCEIHTMPQRSPEWYQIRKGKLTGSSMGSWLADRAECRLTIPELKAAMDEAEVSYPKSAKRDELMVFGMAGGLSFSKFHLKGTIDARHTAACKILGTTDCYDGKEIIPNGEPDPFEVDPDGDPPRNLALWSVWNGMRMEAQAVKSFEEWSGETVEEVGFCEHFTGVSGCSPDGLLKGKPIGFEGKAPLRATHVRYLLDGGLPDVYRDQVHGSMAVTGAESWWFQSYCPGWPPHRVLVHRDDYTERMAEGLLEFAGHLKSAKEEIAALWDEALSQQEFNQ